MENLKYLLSIILIIAVYYKVCRYEKSVKKEEFFIHEKAPEVNYDLEILSRIISGEALGESFQGKLAVASVVLNRVEAKEFPNTIQEVVYQKNQFHGVRSPLFNRPNEDCYRAAKRALEGAIITEALFYANTDTATNRGWIKHIKKLYPKAEKIGNHTFFLKK